MSLVQSGGEKVLFGIIFMGGVEVLTIIDCLYVGYGINNSLLWRPNQVLVDVCVCVCVCVRVGGWVWMHANTDAQQNGRV